MWRTARNSVCTLALLSASPTPGPEACLRRDSRLASSVNRRLLRHLCISCGCSDAVIVSSLAFSPVGGCNGLRLGFSSTAAHSVAVYCSTGHEVQELGEARKRENHMDMEPEPPWLGQVQ